jgi:outer membrane lipoprotein-sorting protein
MKRTITILLFSLLVAATAFAQEGAKKPAADTKPAAKLPTADQVLDKYVQAIGGKAAIEKQTTRTAKGSFEIPAFGASGTAETYAKAPNKSATVINVAGFGVVQEVFDGTHGWSSDPQNGLREKAGAELASTKLDSEFYKPVKLKALYPKIVVKGTDKVGDKEVYVLDATPAEGSTETWYFDTQTGLLLREDAERESPQGKQAIQVFYEDYKDVDGIKMAHSIRQISPAFTLTIKMEEIKHNVPVDDAKFNKPAAQ